MKTLIITMGLLLTGVLTFGQDIIYLKNGENIDAKVVSVQSRTIQYKLHQHLEGPEYEVRKNKVFMIIYEDGRKEMITSSKAASFNPNPNAISLNYGELGWLRLGLSYERQFGDGYMGIKIPVSISFDQNYGYYGNSIRYQSGVDFNYYPLGQRRVSYFTGIGARAGVMESNYYYYYDSYYPYEPLMYQEDILFVAGFVNNGVNWRITDNFSIGGMFGLGVRFSDQPAYFRISPEVAGIGELNATLMF